MLSLFRSRGAAVLAVSCASGLGGLQPQPAFAMEDETAQPLAALALIPPKPPVKTKQQASIEWATESASQRIKRTSDDEPRLGPS